MRPTIREICAEGLDELSLGLIQEEGFRLADARKSLALARSADLLRETDALERWLERRPYFGAKWIQPALFGTKVNWKTGDVEWQDTSSSSSLSEASQR
jgi:hypothetical protein